MSSAEALVHVLVISFPTQGHINPMLRLAKGLASKGLLITFTTTEDAGRRIKKATTTNNDSTTTIDKGQLRFEFFTDGLGETGKERAGKDQMRALETVGRESFTRLIINNSKEGRPISCVINNPFVPWASEVAAQFGIPCAMQWIHSCAVYSIYYHYFHALAPFPTKSQPDLTVHLPGLPPLTADEIPNLLHPFIEVSFTKAMLVQMETLPKYFCVLIDSFEELERETIKSMSHTSPMIRPIGPLFKTSYIANSGVCGDLLKAADNCIKWLDSQPSASVVYISFGSVLVLEKDQMEALAWGLLDSGLSFIWVVRPAAPTQESEQKIDEPDLTLLPDGFIKEAGSRGLVVPWCPQEQVLAHPSVACFLSQCGWNSSLECLGSGVPVVELSMFSDQVTNAKFLVDVYGVGVRIGSGVKNTKRSVSREDVTRSLVEVTQGPKAAELKMNALKWKKAAETAAAEGGSSDKALEAVVDDIRRMATTHSVHEVVV